MQIEVRLYATFRDLLPEGPESFSTKRDVAEGTRVGELCRMLGIPENMPKIVVISGRIVDEAYTLKDGDVVSIFPPIAGG